MGSWEKKDIGYKLMKAGFLSFPRRQFLRLAWCLLALTVLTSAGLLYKVPQLRFSLSSLSPLDWGSGSWAEKTTEVKCPAWHTPWMCHQPASPLLLTVTCLLKGCLPGSSLQSTLSPPSSPPRRAVTMHSPPFRQGSCTGPPGRPRVGISYLELLAQVRLFSPFTDSIA